MFRPLIIELGIAETRYTYAGAPKVCRQLHRLLLPSVVSELAVNQFEADVFNSQGVEFEVVKKLQRAKIK